MRYGRRLVLVVIWLAIFDQFVPAFQRRVEHDLYDGSEVYRFENSDLFPIGPLVSYLREHPERQRPRVAFFGTSVIFGFGLPARAALPARFQELEPGVRVLNAAVNGSQLGNAYLITKATIDSIDRVYVQLVGWTANPMLPSLIPVDDEDIRAFQLDRRSRLESGLQRVVGLWRLYGASYRIQAATFGTSTKQYVYLHKGKLVRRVLFPAFRPAPEPPPEPVDASVEILAPRAPVPPGEQRRAELRERYPVLWQMEELIQRHRKRAVFLLFAETNYIGTGERRLDLRRGLSEQDVADLNAAFAPYGEVMRLRFSAAKMTSDGVHLTPGGAQRVAEALVRHERDAMTQLQ